MTPARAAQQSNSVGLVVISEEDTHRTLLIHRISLDDIYQRQGGARPALGHQLRRPVTGRGDTAGPARAEDTIITWSDAEIGTDIALSFQEAVGCNHIWCAPHRWLAAALCNPSPLGRG